MPIQTWAVEAIYFVRLIFLLWYFFITQSAANCWLPNQLLKRQFFLQIYPNVATSYVRIRGYTTLIYPHVIVNINIIYNLFRKTRKPS